MTPPAANMIRSLRSALGSLADSSTDAALLSRFAQTRDQEAFELLVWRHGGMVLRVGRSILRDHHAAEDAAQAAFLALAAQAGSVCRRGTVAGWLYRVVWRISVKAARRRCPQMDGNLDRIPARALDSDSDPAPLKILHEELARLPEKYRVPLVLSYFEGLTHADAARRLDWPIGTFATRMARAKDCLQRRLARRGVTVPLAGVATLVAADPGAAFVGATVQAATAFAAGNHNLLGVSQTIVDQAQGAIRAMTISKLCWMAGILAACGTLTLGGVWAANTESAIVPVDSPTVETPPARAGMPPAKNEPAERMANSAQRRKSLNNLKQILLAFHNYDTTFGHLPADIRDKDGKPLLSWRVAILPYIEQEALYKQFRLDQSWDSEHNLKLLAKMPATYRVGFEPKDSTHTYYQVFAGPGTPFGPSRFTPGGEGGAGPAPAGGAPAGTLAAEIPPAAGAATNSPAKAARITLAQIADGTSNTLGVVEAGPPVPWSKPADLPYDPKKPLPKLEGPFANALHVATLDGAAYALRRNIDPNVLRILIGMDDGNFTPDIKSLLARLPAETDEEKAALKELIARNEKLIDESEELLKEHVKLLRKRAAEIGDFTQAEEQAERMRRMVEELKMMNERLRTNSKDTSIPPKPAPKITGK